MILSRAQFETVAWALALGLLTIVPHAPWFFSLGLVLLIAIRVVLRRRQIGALHWVPRLILLVAVLVLAVANFGTILGRDAGPLVLSAFTALKLFETESRRDAYLVLTVLCFLCMSLFLFDQGLLQIALTTTALIAILYALLRLQPESESQSFAAKRRFRPQRNLLRLATATVLMAIPFAVAAFVLFPRFSSPLWGSPEQLGQGKTGISDEMEPGQFSSLALDDSPAFRARFETNRPPPPPQRYWRGPVMWHFDGERWTISRHNATTTAKPEEIRFSQSIRYSVSLERSYRRYLFALDVPVKGPTGSHLSRDRQLFQSSLFSGVMKYEAESAPEAILQDALDRYERHLSLELPPGRNPRATALAQQWASLHAGNTTAVIEEALRLFNREFIYSLDPQPLVGERMDDFLFNTKTGYCEHFSSAFVVLMRAAGIPARVVTGYLGGIWNPNGNYLLVANSDAHAWSEVWLEGRGWVRIDPTAAVAPERINRGGREFGQQVNPTWMRSSWLTDLRLRADLIRAWWNDTVVEFNARKQTLFLERMGVNASDWKRLGALLLVVGALAIVLPIVWLRWRERRRQDPVLRIYARFCAHLGRFGLMHQASDGPLAFADRAATAFPQQADAIRSLSQHFVFLRYDSVQPDKSAIRAFDLAVRRFIQNHVH